MPFITEHVRITNSGKIPDLFLTSKIQAPSELADAKLGKLYFLLQIDAPWDHVSTIGTSAINMIGREYYRQEDSLPIQNFERAIAKANQLIHQLTRENESLRQHFHALVALTVGDEVHIAWAGEAEAYFLRDNKLNLITEPGKQSPEDEFCFNNLLTGEVSANDIIFLGNPGLYGAITTDELALTLRLPLAESALRLAKHLKSLKARKANAIIIQCRSVKATENAQLESAPETLYLDQRLESNWSVLRFYLGQILRPVGRGVALAGNKLREGLVWLRSTLITSWEQQLKPKFKQAQSKAHGHSPSLLKNIPASLSFPKISLPKLPTQFKVKLPVQLPGLNLKKSSDELLGNDLSIAVNHYLHRRGHQPALARAIRVPLQLLQDLGRQLRAAIKRSPRTWYIIIALLLLSSLGASIQTQKQKIKLKPVITTATLDQAKELVNQAKQAKVYGNNQKARELYLEAIAKAELAKDNPKLASQASSLLGSIQPDFYALSGAQELTSPQPLLKLADDATVATIYEGILYYVTPEGALKSLLLTGGEPTELGQLPNSQAIHQLTFNTDHSQLYLQDYTGALFSYDLAKEELKVLNTDSALPVASGLDFFNNTLYLLDPAGSQINKYTLEADQLAEAGAYLKKKTDLSQSLDLAIDGSLFVLFKDGRVSKFSRGTASQFSLTAIPSPFDQLHNPLGFFAVEDGTSYYLADRGNDKIPARFLEFDKNGKFIHQYLLPKRWQGDIKLVMANPKSHKAWVMVKKDLFEFTLVQ